MGAAGSVLLMGMTVVHGSTVNITPLRRVILYLNVSTVDNRGESYERPEYYAARDFALDGQRRARAADLSNLHLVFADEAAMLSALESPVRQRVHDAMAPILPLFDGNIVHYVWLIIGE